ncbi:F5/8 type C domain-containing protein [Xenococcus sp. PCC 7305]|uniref:FkbM family methyltransferase n=1 Tax=Xenococcus sp. PCC 7305 TaxID=102125 RepID=UPI0002ACEE60|nr:FkbM family methyltransferase [Xenococcus sp. PCC 7305]ELS05588.1 F5/8 type C domain-containing protein [Xenococcus sp. PCC 7305]
MLASNLYSQETSDHKNRQNFSGTATINAKSTHPCPIKMLRELRLPLPQGIVHVGANSGRDEIPTYQKLNLKNCAYIEPIPTVFKELTKNLEGISNHYPIQALCADLTGEEVVFNVASNQGRSSSMFPWGRHKTLYPQTEYVEQLKIQTITLDEIVETKLPDADYDLLVMDTQGSELKVLMGSHRLLKENLTYIFTEVGEDPLYEGGCTFDEVTAFLKLYGFRLKNMVLNYKNWGNALYVKDVPKPSTENIALNKPTQQSSLAQDSQPKESQKAVNGIRDGKPSFCTAQEVNPWWQVDLEDTYALTEVRVYNCIDQGEETVRTLKILVSLDESDWQELYINHEGLIFGGTAGRPLVVPVKSQMARYVRLQLNEQTSLHLDQIEVYGFSKTV